MAARQRPPRDMRRRVREATRRAGVASGASARAIAGRAWLNGTSLDVPDEIGDPRVLQRWWKSGTDLKLLAALVTASRIPVGPDIPVPDLCAYFVQVLEHGADERRRVLAASGLFGLGTRHENLWEERFSVEVPEIVDTIERALTRDRTRGPVLLAARQFQASFSRRRRFCPIRNAVIDRILRTPGLTTQERLDALHWQRFVKGDRDLARGCAVRLLDDPRTPAEEIPFLAGLISESDDRWLRGFLANDLRPVERRVQVLDHLDRHVVAVDDAECEFGVDPEDDKYLAHHAFWDGIIARYGEHPELSAAVIRRLTNDHAWRAWPHLVQIGERADLPPVVRRELVRFICQWQADRSDSDPEGSAFATFLDVASYPGVLGELGPSLYLGGLVDRMTPALRARILALLRDARSPLTERDRRVLVPLLTSFEDVSPDDYALVKDLLVASWAQQPPPQVAHFIVRCLSGLARSELGLWREILADEASPSEIRVAVLNALSRQERLRFLAGVPVDHPLRERFCASLEADVLWPLWDELSRAARFDTPSWKELLGRPSSFTGEAAELYSVIRDRAASPLCRLTAIDWASRMGADADPTFQLTVRDGVLADADAPFAVLCCALGQLGDSPQAYSDELLRRLSRPDVPDAEVALGARLLARLAPNILPALVGHPGLASARRHALLAVLADTPEWSPTWSEWRDVVTKSADSAIATRILRGFTQRGIVADVTDLYALVTRTDLATDLRAAALGQIWFTIGRCGALSAPGVPNDADSFLRGLLALGSERDLVATAFRDGDLSELGATRLIAIDGETFSIALAQARDTSLPLPYRCVLAAYLLPPTRAYTPDDRRQIASVLSDALPLATPRGQSLLWALIGQHAIARREGMVELVANPEVPLAERRRIYTALTEREKLGLFHVFPEDEHEKLLDGVHLPTALQEELVRAAREANPVLRDVIQSREFLGSSLADWLRYVGNARFPRLARWLAAQLLETQWSLDAAQSWDLFETAIEAARDPHRDELAKSTITRVLRHNLPVPIQNAAYDRFVQELRDPQRAPEFRRYLIRSMNSQILFQNFRSVVEVIRTLGDVGLEADLFTELGRRHGIVVTSDLESVLHALRAGNESARRELRALEACLTANWIDLLRHAHDSRPFVRENALQLLLSPEKATTVAPRQVWEYLASPAGARVWQDPDLQEIVVRYVTKDGCSSLVRDIIQDGPQHRAWPSLIALSRYPDHTLVKRAFLAFDADLPPDWASWRDTHVSDVPAPAALGVWQIVQSSPDPDDLASRINRAFRAVKGSHATTADLTDILMRVAISPSGVRTRIARVAAAATPEQSDAGFSKNFFDLWAYANLEARVVARLQGTNRHGGDFSSEPDLTDSRDPRLADIAAGAPLDAAVDRLRQSARQQILPSLPGVDAVQWEKVMRTTSAPAVLAAHYQGVFRAGLPLLAQAIAAASQGETAWHAWRYDRDAARRGQLAFLSDEQCREWARDRQRPVHPTAVPADIAEVAAVVRARFQKALRTGELPDEYRSLVQDSGVPPAQRIADYRAMQKIIGQSLGDESPPVVLPDDLAARLPRPLIEEIPRGRDGSDRKARLRLQQRLSRAISLLRLLHCDSQALAYNQILAVGEVGSDATVRGAVVLCEKLREELPHDGLREARLRDRERSPLDPAFAETIAALKRIENFASRKSLVAVETSAFKDLIEIGNRPYGQGSCQNYASVSPLNRALLAYVVDAMTKAIVLRTTPTPDNPEGTPVARAIIKLGQVDKVGLPTLVLERVYAAGGEAQEYAPLIEQAARAFAGARGWRLARIIEREAEVTQEACGLVWIPTSQSGCQYEDGLQQIIDSGDLRSYSMKVQFLV